MWLHQELKEINIESLSVRQQLDLLQNNGYVTCNINYLIQARLFISQSDTYANSGLSALSRLQQESDIVWNNIYLYIETYFPLVWSETKKLNFFPTIPTFSGKEFDPKQEQDNKIQSLQYFIEACRTLVYGGILRLPFSQDSFLSNLFQKLLIACQLSDIQGRASIAGQRRVIFLQQWIQKLVLRNSLPVFINSTLNTGSPQRSIKAIPIPITAPRAYIAKKIHIQSVPSSNLKPENLEGSISSDTTTFSSYLHRHDKNSSSFIGLKLKFEKDDSEDSYSTIHSEDSIWKPAFKKRKS